MEFLQLSFLNWLGYDWPLTSEKYQSVWFWANMETFSETCFWPVSEKTALPTNQLLPTTPIL